MIASVIAKLSSARVPLADTLGDIAAHPAMETGALVQDRLLPIAIETDDGQSMESLTRWLQSLAGVEFVDVVFVHFEEDPS